VLYAGMCNRCGDFYLGPVMDERNVSDGIVNYENCEGLCTYCVL
jgi:hypothetical protein